MSTQEKKDVIVYEVWSNAGGVDGRSGELPRLIACFFNRESAEENRDKSYTHIKPVVLQDIAGKTKTAMATLKRDNPIEFALVHKFITETTQTLTREQVANERRSTGLR